MRAVRHLNGTANPYLAQSRWNYSVTVALLSLIVIVPYELHANETTDTWRHTRSHTDTLSDLSTSESTEAEPQEKPEHSYP